ncbi:MAG TPA: hypothetical protein VGM18_09640 [Candidatus Sulfotelmatobacter sp.]|jgi:hypothetical protein
MKKPEIPPGNWILIELANVPDSSGVLKLVKSYGIAAGFLSKPADGPGILNAAVNHLLLAVPSDFEGYGWRNDGRGDYKKGHEKGQRQQDIAALRAFPPTEISDFSHHTKIYT